MEEIGIEENVFITDEYDAYFEIIPHDQHFVGKDLTYPIEQSNSDVRHCLARFRRRSKTTSRCVEMVNTSLKLLHNLQNPEIFKQFQRLSNAI